MTRAIHSVAGNHISAIQNARAQLHIMVLAADSVLMETTGQIDLVLLVYTNNESKHACLAAGKRMLVS